ncbi:hypothetical protein EDB86DRAFT_3240126 [Lactarius hatsudake]|nr:hypothetical protein EDB86DRAFT_3240126 [Lactarius hatsudake]
MRYHCISVLSVFATSLLGGLAKPLSPPWDNMHIKHSWNAVPRNWESLGHPPSGTTIDLYIALKPQRENARTSGTGIRAFTSIASGPGIPDIAAQAFEAWIFLNGNEREEGGTSLATPVVAGIISRVWVAARMGSPLLPAGWDAVTGLGTPNFRKMLEQIF